MSRKANNRLPRREKTAEHVTLPEKHATLRLWLVIGLILVAAGAFAYGVMHLLGRQAGWTEIETTAGYEGTCAGELTLQYELGTGGAVPGPEYRQVEALYTRAATEAYQIFHARETFEGVGNLASLSASPNEAVEIDPALYAALELLEEQGGRYLYLAPVYESYSGLFACQDEYEAASWDPARSQEAADWIREAAAYAADPEAVSVELLGDGRARLRVSEDYLAFAREGGVTALLDLYWMENAFRVDYVADALAEGGYLNGVLSSYDGFIRCLDGRGTVYGLDLYDRAGQSVYPAGQMGYTGPMSLVALRDFPLAQLDAFHYYTRSDGEIVTAYVDPADGLSRTAASFLAAYAPDRSCAQVLLEVVDLYVADSLDEAALLALPAEGVDLVLCRDRTVLYTQRDLAVTDLFDNGEVRYAARLWE